MSRELKLEIAPKDTTSDTPIEALYPRHDVETRQLLEVVICGRSADTTSQVVGVYIDMLRIYRLLRSARPGIRVIPIFFFFRWRIWSRDGSREPMRPPAGWLAFFSSSATRYETMHEGHGILRTPQRYLAVPWELRRASAGIPEQDAGELRVQNKVKHCLSVACEWHGILLIPRGR